jgi:hypothetical protein
MCITTLLPYKPPKYIRTRSPDAMFELPRLRPPKRIVQSQPCLCSMCRKSRDVETRMCPEAVPGRIQMSPLNNEVCELQWSTQSIEQILPGTRQMFGRIQGSNSPEKGEVYSAQFEFPSLLPKNNLALPRYSCQSIDTNITNNTNSFVSISSISSSTLPLHNNINSLPVKNINLVPNNNNNNNRVAITDKPKIHYINTLL